MVILSVLSDKHVAKTNGSVIKDNTQHCLNYKDAVHDKLTIVASSMLSNLKERIIRYECKRVSITKWLVKKKKNSRKPNKRFPIPDFDVLHDVVCEDTTKTDTKQLSCTCNYTKVYGLPCVHSIVVAESLRPNWKEITHNDVSVRW